MCVGSLDSPSKYGDDPDYDDCGCYYCDYPGHVRASLFLCRNIVS
jgi:hypothetical protein